MAAAKNDILRGTCNRNIFLSNLPAIHDICVCNLELERNMLLVC